MGYRVKWEPGQKYITYTTEDNIRCRDSKLFDPTLLRENIKQSERVSTPFVLGIFRPVIYLPYHLAEEDLAYVVAHERAHIGRRDHWWKPLGFALLCVYWFNPLLWLAYVLLCRDMEGACDEAVIETMGWRTVGATPPLCSTAVYAADPLPPAPWPSARWE